MERLSVVDVLGDGAVEDVACRMSLYAFAKVAGPSDVDDLARLVGYEVDPLGFGCGGSTDRGRMGVHVTRAGSKRISAVDVSIGHLGLFIELHVRWAGRIVVGGPRLSGGPAAWEAAVPRPDCQLDIT